MKKELIFDDSKKLQNICNGLSGYLPYLQGIKSRYEDFEIGDFNNDVLQEINTKGTKGIETRYIKFLNDNMTRAGITSTLIRQNLIKSNELVIFKFNEAIKQLKAYSPPIRSGQTWNSIRPSDISYFDGEFFITDETKNRIMEEQCRVYIETDSQREIFQAFTDLAAAFQKINEVEAKHKLKMGKGNGYDYLGRFIGVDGNQLVLKPYELKHLWREHL